ncbi:MAG: division/cell wall cluster transcriptional repressor MraZ [Clostridia bacterium]|nr:division/cell wall cluster transcriptional repressor MraZ [Clostridia bacterium]
MLISSYEHAVDAKGRVFIPAKWREDLGGTVIVMRGLTGSGEDKCLTCMSMESWQEMLAKFKTVAMSDVAAQRALRSLFASASDCDADKQGRILISASLREYAGIEKDAVLVGMGNRVEIWSGERWKEYCEREDAPTDDVWEHLMGLGI